MMNCENYWCVYQENGKCICDDEADLNVLGQCIDCIYVDIPEEDLKSYKEIHREKIRNY